MVSFLHDVFRSFGEGVLAGERDVGGSQPCGGALTGTVEHVVDETYSRLRALPGYSRRLKEPVAETLRYIDSLVEGVPGAILCSRSAFREDPSVNAFFVDPKHMREVFSGNAEVREFLDSNPDTKECWAVLYMRRDERRHLGMSLVGDAVQRDVMQTAVSFTDHQVVAPGGSEDEAKCALKCRIFNGLLSFIRNKADASKTLAMDLENRLKSVRGRLSHAAEGEGHQELRAELQAKIDNLELKLAQQDLRLASLEDYLDFVAYVLGNPTEYLSNRTCAIRLSRMGIKLEDGSLEAGYEVPLSEVRIGSQESRVGALVRFPRSELLPQQDFLTRADLFLAL